jgi:tetratricopeptide (TPR) repeat protein
LEENTLNASTEKQMRLYYALALDYHALERYSEAIECYQHTIEFSRQHNNTEYLAKAYRGLAVVQYNQDNLTFTRVYAYQAIGVSETINEVDAIIRLKGGLARALAKHNQTDEALYNAQEAFELAEQTGDLPNILTAYVNLSNVTMQAKNFEQALEYAQAGVAKLKKAEDSKAKVDKITAGYVFGQLAAVLNRRGREKDRNQVRKHMDKALNYLQQSPFNQYLSSMYYNYAQVLEEWGELAEALQYIKKAVALGYATKPPVLEF